MSLFCRHNRFTADCPICSKGTVLEGAGTAPARTGTATATRPAAKRKPAAAPAFRGPYASTPSYPAEDGETYEVRLERVPGGLRFGSWRGGVLERRAPVMAGADLDALIAAAAERDLLGEGGEALVDALRQEVRHTGEGPSHGASGGRSGEIREELRVEPLGDGRVRIARWTQRPRAAWELQEAPTMFAPKRYAEALREAVRKGLLSA